jgi:hypothetical protein
MYDEVRGSLFGGQPLEISQNFRSVEPIIDWVERRLPPHRRAARHSRATSTWCALPPPRPRSRTGDVSAASRPARSGFAIDVRAREAEALASLIAARRGCSGGWRACAGVKAHARPAQYRDVAY